MLIDKYNNIVNDIENGKSINMDEFLFLLASGEEGGFTNVLRNKIEIKSEKDFIESVINPMTDNFASWVEIDDWVYIDIHLPHEPPKAIKVYIRDIETLCGPGPIEYKLLIYKCEWV